MQGESVSRIPVCRIDLVTRLDAVTHSGRLVLSQQRRRNICRQLCEINRIPAIAGMARKRSLLAINLMTPAELSPHRSLLRSM